MVWDWRASLMLVVATIMAFLTGLWSVNVNNAFSGANGNIGGSHSCVICVYKLHIFTYTLLKYKESIPTFSITDCEI